MVLGWACPLTVNAFQTVAKYQEKIPSKWCFFFKANLLLDYHN